jgi:endonuclease YncB( thermonuclease family)
MQLQRNAIILALGLAGLLIWGYLVAAAGRSLQEEPVDYNLEDMDIPDPSELDLPDAGSAIEPQVESRRVRPIEPEAFASPAVANADNLERIAPREPLSEKRMPAKPQVVLLPRPVSVQAGVVAFGDDQRIRLADIEATALERTCPSPDAPPWPCGMVARTQQRLLLRNRSLACETSERQWVGEIQTRCWVGTLDVSTWLARHGWAEASRGSTLAMLTEQARNDRKGLFGEAVH